MYDVLSKERVYVPKNIGSGERSMNKRKETVDGLFLQHNAYILNICRSKGLSEEDAKDVLSETFLRFWQNIDDLIDLVPLQHKKWLYTTAVNITHEKIRQHINIEPADISELEATVAEENNGIDAAIEEQAFEHLLTQIGSELSDTEKKTLDMIFEHERGVSYEELSEKYGLRSVTLRSMIHRLRKNVKTILEKLAAQ